MEQETEGTRGAAAARPRRSDAARALREPLAHAHGELRSTWGRISGNTLTDGRVPGGRRAAARAVGQDALRGWRARSPGTAIPNLPARDGSSTLAYGGLPHRRHRAHRRLRARRHALVPARQRREAERRLRRRERDLEHLVQDEARGPLHARHRLLRRSRCPETTPTNLNETVEVFVEKFLTRSVYLRLFARQYRLVSDGDVMLVPSDGGLVVSERNDRVREAGGELGYQFRSRIRAGINGELHGPRLDDRDLRGRGAAGRLHAAVQPAAAHVPLMPAPSAAMPRSCCAVAIREPARPSASSRTLHSTAESVGDPRTAAILRAGERRSGRGRGTASTAERQRVHATCLVPSIRDDRLHVTPTCSSRVPVEL